MIRPPTARRPALIATLVAALATATACGGDATPATHTIVIEAMRFQPDTLSVHAGDQLVWINRDLFPHTVVSAAGQFQSGPIAPGQSWRVTLRRTGVFAYGCSLHPTMHAKISVE